MDMSTNGKYLVNRKRHLTIVKGAGHISVLSSSKVKE